MFRYQIKIIEVLFFVLRAICGIFHFKMHKNLQCINNNIKISLLTPVSNGNIRLIFLHEEMYEIYNLRQAKNIFHSTKTNYLKETCNIFIPKKLIILTIISKFLPLLLENALNYTEIVLIK